MVLLEIPSDIALSIRHVCQTLFSILILLLLTLFKIIHFVLAPIPDKSPPCAPSPCGPNAICREIADLPSCSCLSGYIGSPPHCRPECTNHNDCPNNLACISEKCKDPCVGSCGVNAICSVINHIPICTCLENYIGDPFSNCYPPPPPRKLPLDLF